MLVTGKVSARSRSRTVTGSTGWIWRVRDGKVMYVRVYASAADAIAALEEDGDALGPPPRPQQVVHLLLLSHDDVLEAVLHGLGGGLAAGGLDRRLERLERLAPRSRSARRSPWPGRPTKLIGATSVVGSPPSAVIFSTSRVASSSSDSACSRIFSAWAWYSSPITLPATSE